MKDFILVVLFFVMIFGAMYLADFIDKLTAKIPSEVFMNGLMIAMFIGIGIAIKKALARN